MTQDALHEPGELPLGVRTYQTDIDTPWWLTGVPFTDQDVPWPLDVEASEILVPAEES